MLKNGFVKVSCVTPKIEVGNPWYNVKQILRNIENNKASIIAFPELSLTGYTCGDLFFQSLLLNDVLKSLEFFLQNNKSKSIIILGAPLENEGSLYNCAIVIKENKILGVVPKRNLPNSREFFEKRYFKSIRNSSTNIIEINGNLYPFGHIIFNDSKNDIHFGIEICEDMWAPISPGSILSTKGANMIVNLSASNEVLGKEEVRRNAVLDKSRSNCGAYIYSNAGTFESTSDTVYSGHIMVAVNGELRAESKELSIEEKVLYADIDINKINYVRRNNTNIHEFDLDYNVINIDFSLDETEFSFEKAFDNTPFVPKDDIYNNYKKITSILEHALYKRIKHTNSKSVIIGVSGGLDSTLALLICVKTFKMLNMDLKNIIAVTMPGLGTTNRTKSNALELMNKLGVTVLEKSIVESTNKHFELIGHDINVVDVTYENVQARIRTLTLMNLANKYNGIVLGTGDMSELALGWCTYNGDQMSMYGINAGLPKTLVRFVTQQYAVNDFIEIKDIILDVIATPISPELVENQKTEDSLGTYEINDYILYRFLACGDDEQRIKELLKITFGLTDDKTNAYVNKFFFRFFTQQFKRQALPDGPKVLEVSLNARGDFRMPSDIKRWE